MCDGKVNLVGYLVAHKLLEPRRIAPSSLDERVNPLSNSLCLNILVCMGERQAAEASKPNLPSSDSYSTVYYYSCYS